MPSTLGLEDDEADILLEELEAREVAVRQEVGHALLWRLAGRPQGRDVVVARDPGT